MQDITIKIRLQATRTEALVERGNKAKIVAFDYDDDNTPEPDGQSSSLGIDVLNRFDDLLPLIEEAVDALADLEFPDIKTDPPKKKPKKEAAPGKPPYHLLDAADKRRKLLIIDPFEVQLEQKGNKKLQFDDLEAATKVAEMLITEGSDTQITIAYSNGKPAKVITEDELQEAALS